MEVLARGRLILLTDSCLSPCSTEVAALTPAALSKDMMSLQLGTAGKELQLAEKSSDLLQNVSMTEGLE